MRNFLIDLSNRANVVRCFNLVTEHIPCSEEEKYLRFLTCVLGPVAVTVLQEPPLPVRYVLQSLNLVELVIVLQ